MRNPEYAPFCEAYLQMVKEAHYRPQSPQDGWGNLLLSEEDLGDYDLLKKEAGEYATKLTEEIKSRNFLIGSPDGTMYHAFAYTIEGARLLCGSIKDNQIAVKLLKMAIAAIHECNSKV